MFIFVLFVLFLNFLSATLLNGRFSCLKKTQGYDKFTLGVSWVSGNAKNVFYAGQ